MLFIQCKQIYVIENTILIFIVFIKTLNYKICVKKHPKVHTTIFLSQLLHFSYYIPVIQFPLSIISALLTVRSKE